MAPTGKRTRFAAPEAPASFDPADLDGIEDETTAKRKKSKLTGKDAPDLGPSGPGTKQMRLRAQVPVIDEYKGKKVGREEVFAGESTDGGEDDEEEAFSEMDEALRPDDDDGEEEPDLSGPAAGGFSISGNLEEEYDKMMKQTRHELEVMRKPSSAEVAKKESEGRRLKHQLDAWSSLVELRIHLEGSLGLSHRLPVVGHGREALLCETEAAAAKETEGLADDLSGLLGNLCALQQRFAERRKDDIPLPKVQSEAAGDEAASWQYLDSRQRPVLDWALGVADDWKERTRLDVKRSFKVLDQSLSSQMQALVETEAEKVRRRSVPPPGRHSVFGAQLLPAEDAATSSSSRKPASDAKAQSAGAGEEQHIFDDRDFYVQLLREVLASGSAASGDAGQDLQAELQGRRSKQKKPKNEVERRASKGRKIRYVPIERLQNFMAPRARSEASEGALGVPIDALMKSLFAS
eukprot:TRINITY_DN23091_c0_g4_i1.p1 TRINITY_DN23091_c0_g4~~TRINITY_DN23091_c0_g4_i1.p1  ORF type:complete len:464 (+),score=154.58 TRINITY_DN23091_c0_g4_i1:106-1497(+)